MNTLKYNTTAIYFLLSNLLSTIIYVLTLCRSESSLEIGDAVFLVCQDPEINPKNQSDKKEAPPYREGDAL